MRNKCSRGVFTPPPAELVGKVCKWRCNCGSPHHRSKRTTLYGIGRMTPAVITTMIRKITQIIKKIIIRTTIMMIVEIKIIIIRIMNTIIVIMIMYMEDAEKKI